jgi:leucyl aminopeptidase
LNLWAGNTRPAPSLTGENVLKTFAVIFAWLGLVAAAHGEQRFEFAPFAIPADGRIVVPVAEGESLSGIAATIDQRTNGALTVAATEAAFTGEANASVTLYGVSPYSRIDLIGVGAESVTRASAENFGGTAAALLADTTGGSVQILWNLDSEDAAATAARVAFGYSLRSYRFDKYQADRVDPDTLPVVRLLSDDNSAAALGACECRVPAGVRRHSARVIRWTRQRRNQGAG